MLIWNVDSFLAKTKTNIPQNTFLFIFILKRHCNISGGCFYTNEEIEEKEKHMVILFYASSLIT